MNTSIYAIGRGETSGRHGSIAPPMLENEGLASVMSLSRCHIFSRGSYAMNVMIFMHETPFISNIACSFHGQLCLTAPSGRTTAVPLITDIFSDISIFTVVIGCFHSKVTSRKEMLQYIPN